MNEIKNLLLKELKASKDPGMFWDELMTFTAEQLNAYLEAVNKTGLDILIQKSEDQELLKVKLSKDIEDIKNVLVKVAKFNHYTSSLKQANLEKDKEIERLNRDIENAKDYLRIKEKDLEKAKTKVEQELIKKLEHARTQINAIIELSNQADGADIDVIKKLPDKIRLNAQDVARTLKNNKLWPEEEKLAEIKTKINDKGEQDSNSGVPLGSNNNTKKDTIESDQEQFSFDTSVQNNKETK